MQNALEYALKTIYEANEPLVAADPQNCPDKQFTMLDVAPILSTLGFCLDVLALVSDQTLHTWRTHYYKPLDPRLQLEIINLAQTKMVAYSGIGVARRTNGWATATLLTLGLDLHVLPSMQQDAAATLERLLTKV